MLMHRKPYLIPIMKTTFYRQLLFQCDFFFCPFQISVSSEDLANQNLRDTQVLNTKENKMWDWDLIGYVLKVI